MKDAAIVGIPLPRLCDQSVASCRMTEPVEREAACSCGQLRIRTAGAPSIVSSCHCLACQRRTGSLFGAAAFFPRPIVATEGERSTFRRQAESGAWLAFHFCPKCGSTVFWENERLPDIVSIAVGAFADPHFPPPVRTVWTTTKHDWLAFPERPPSSGESGDVGSALGRPAGSAPLQWRVSTPQTHDRRRQRPALPA